MGREGKKELGEPAGAGKELEGGAREQGWVGGWVLGGRSITRDPGRQ